MPIHRSTAVPVPPDVLERARRDLAPQYGSLVWEGDGQRVLLVRVPGDEPDPVNDVEAAIEYLMPGDATGLTQCLLIAERRIGQVYPQPLRDLMAARVAFDQKECARLRVGLEPHAHSIYTSPDDPRRIVRMALRLPLASVHELEDEDLDRFAASAGPELEERVGTVRALYLVAHEDHARLDPALLLPDLLKRWREAEETRMRDEEIRRRSSETRRRREEERRTLLENLRRRFGQTTEPSRQRHPPKVLRAPLRTAPDRPEGWEAAEEAAHAMVAGLDRIRDRVGGLDERVGRNEAAQGRPPDVWRRAEAALERCGYAVMVRPDTPGHTVDLAAERSGEHPERVLVRFSDRLTVDLAQEVLATVRALGADALVVVAPHADEEALRRLVATKGRHVPLDDLDRLRL